MSEVPEVKITVRPNGPYRVEGPVKLVDAEGREECGQEGEEI